MSELVTDYMENALPRIPRLRAGLHLVLCSSCRAYFDQFGKTVRLLNAMPAMAKDSSAEDRVLDAIASRPPEPDGKP